MVIIMETMKRDGAEGDKRAAGHFSPAANNTDRENICYTIYLTNQPAVQPNLRDACLRNRI